MRLPLDQFAAANLGKAQTELIGVASRLEFAAITLHDSHPRESADLRAASTMVRLIEDQLQHDWNRHLDALISAT